MPEKASLLAGPGRVRMIAARWVIKADIVLESAASFGGRGDELCDMPILRDPLEGLPLLPGTTLAGALRSHLSDYLGGYASEEPREVSALFGDLDLHRKRQTESDSGDKEQGTQSPLVVFDSLGAVPEGKAIEIRDGVAIDPDRGTAENHKKFDFEVIPSGTVFPLCLELVVDDISREAELLDLLRMSLTGLAEGSTAVGMRRSRGLGRVKTRNWQACRYDLSTEDGWLSWLTTDPESPISDNTKPANQLDDALGLAWDTWVPTDIARKDKRQRVAIDLSLRICGALLVRSPGVTADSPDVIHLTSAGMPVLPGTSLAGVLRNRALRIATLVKGSKEKGDKWVSDLFGPRFEGKIAPPGFEYKASRLRVSESFIEDGIPMRPTRICIDRLTQGVMPTALFDEQPIYEGTARIHLELQNPKDSEIGLLLLLVKDLLTGDLPVGGSSSIGRGLVRGSATVHLFVDNLEIAIGEDLKVEKSEWVEELDRKIRCLTQASEERGSDKP